MSLFGIDLSKFSENNLLILAIVILILFFIFQIFKLIIEQKNKTAEANQPITHADISSLVAVTNKEIDNMKEIVLESTRRTTDSHEKVCNSLNEVALCLRDVQNSTQQQVQATQQLTNVMTMRG